MLHEIRNLRIDENNSNVFRFDYRGRDMQFLTNSINERLGSFSRLRKREMIELNLEFYG